MEKIPMTAAGLSSLETELRHRQAVERPRIVQQITEARSHGDLSENAEYHAAKEQQSLNEGRIAELEDKISRAEVIDVSKLSGDTITFGATVTLVDEDTDEKESLADRRRHRGRRQGRPHIDLLAARARADRQEERHFRRGNYTQRPEGLRSAEGGVAVNHSVIPGERTARDPGSINASASGSRTAASRLPG